MVCIEKEGNRWKTGSKDAGTVKQQEFGKETKDALSSLIHVTNDIDNLCLLLKKKLKKNLA